MKLKAIQAIIKFIFHLHLLEGIVDMASLASREHGVDLLGPQSGPDVLVVRMVNNVALWKSLSNHVKFVAVNSRIRLSHQQL